MKLTVEEAFERLKTIDFPQFSEPSLNKGGRGQLIETAIGVSNSSDLTDLLDGELKSFTVGQTISITQVNHCLEDIIEKSCEFEESKVGQKLKQTIYIAFDKDSKHLKTVLISDELDKEHYEQLAEDYGFISAQIRRAYNNGETLTTITGPNNLLQIRTKASKNRDGLYTPMTYNGTVLKDKHMAFYLLSNFGKQITK